MNLIMPALTANTLRQSTGLMTALSIIPHLFCCGIPAVAALISLGTTVGLAASLAGNPFYQFVDAWHTELLMVAVASVIVSGILNFIAYRMDCRAAGQDSLVKGHCAHADCTPKKTSSFKIFVISVVLLMLDIAWFITEEKVLGLHHHHGEAHAEAPAAQTPAAAPAAGHDDHAGHTH
jgi:hypothetical protein